MGVGSRTWAASSISRFIATISIVPSVSTATSSAGRTPTGKNSPIDYRLISTGPDDEPGINGALSTRDGAIDSQSVIAFVNTIEVDDLPQTERRIGTAGGERLVEPARIPGVGTVAYLKDTEGNIFAALQPA